MTVLERITALWLALLNASALGAASLSTRLRMQRRLQLREDGAREIVLVGAGNATIRLPAEGVVPEDIRRRFRGSRVSLDLEPGRFLFRSIDVPARATEFVGAIVRSQIDRLTPWRPDRVLFAWTTPGPQGPDGNVAVTIAATDLAHVGLVLDRVERLGAVEIEASVTLPPDAVPAGSTAHPPLMIVRRSATTLWLPVWKRLIGGVTASTIVAVIAASLYGQIISSQSSAEMEEITRGTAAKRAQLARLLSQADPSAGSRLLVERHRAEVPYATTVLEAAAHLLPDDSFITSFDLTGTRLQLVGFTHDAPALIRIFGRSDLFSGASFFAPTTRLANDVADRFSIEATVRPGAQP